MGDWHLELVGKFKKQRRSHAAHAALVFADLLISNANSRTERHSADSKVSPALSDALADMSVNMIAWRARHQGAHMRSAIA